MAGGTKTLGMSEVCTLALEIRSQRFGFAVVEGGQLLDWGVREHGGQPLVASQKVASLVDLYGPAAVVIRKRERHRHPSDVFPAIRSALRLRAVILRLVSAKKVRAHFAELGGTTKFEIAKSIAQRFPELAWSVPPKRKPWQSESYHAAIFDAAATASAFLAHHRNQKGSFDGPSPGE